MDTLEVRRGQIESFMDSVRTLQNAHQEETRLLEAQVDSLRQVLSQAEGESIEHAATLQMLQQQVDSLRTLITAHRQETERLSDEIQEAIDLADRIKNPEKYRKNTALVTGEGDFPNRDALPKR
jgi:chromosome segregation ATPase